MASEAVKFDDGVLSLYESVATRISVTTGPRKLGY